MSKSVSYLLENILPVYGPWRIQYLCLKYQAALYCQLVGKMNLKYKNWARWKHLNSYVGYYSFYCSMAHDFLPDPALPNEPDRWDFIPCWMSGTPGLTKFNVAEVPAFLNRFWASKWVILDVSWWLIETTLSPGNSTPSEALPTNTCKIFKT